MFVLIHTGFVLSTLALLVSSAPDNFNFNGLGDRISNSVNQQLKPLNNLGARIRANVRRQLDLDDTIGDDLDDVSDEFPSMETSPGLNDFGDNLGDTITAEVNAGLAPLSNLDNLGDTITAQVNAGLAPLSNLDNLGETITAQVNSGLAPLRNLDNLGDRISAQVNHQLAPLQNLGSQIEQSVYNGLAPVRAMEEKLKMKQGVGGVTIAKHFPGGRVFIIQDYQTYECSGTITTNGQCQGELVPFKIKEKSDFCYVKNNYSQVNNLICIGGSSVSVVNGVVSCHSATSPVLTISVPEYKELCNNLSVKVEYKYIGDPSNPQHVAIPSKNPVECKNNEVNVCIFDESLNFVGSSSVNVNVVSYNSN